MNLMEGLIQELNRVNHTVVPAFEEIGLSGKLALALINRQVKLAEKAMGDGDTIAMLVCLNDLREIYL